MPSRSATICMQRAYPSASADVSFTTVQRAGAGQRLGTILLATAVGRNTADHGCCGPVLAAERQADSPLRRRPAEPALDRLRIARGRWTAGPVAAGPRQEVGNARNSSDGCATGRSGIGLSCS
jgi:hypothetical protein